MDLSPNDIRNYEFPSQMRGYDKDAVDSFLDQVAEAMDELKQENLKLSLEIDSLNKQLQSVKQYEDAIKSAAIDARRNADQTVAAAKEEAASILEIAKAKAVELVGTRVDQVEQLNNQLNQLENVRNSYLEKIRDLIHSHLDIVKEIEEVELERAALPQLPDTDDFELNGTGSIEVTDSNEVGGAGRETIATQPSGKEGAEYEEANDPGEIIPVHTEAPKQPETDDSDGSENRVDPELAKAIGNYKSEDDFSDVNSQPDLNTDVLSKPQAQPAPAPQPPAQPAPPAPAQDEWVETSKRAEDVPDGFIAQTGGVPIAHSRDTGKIPTQNAPDQMKVDTAKVQKKSTGQFNPDDIAHELDAVAAKFEEEMNRAEQNK